MRWGLVAAIAGCGRIGFDALPPVPPDAPAAPDVGYFVSPTGDDANPGTRALPWQSFGFSIPRLGPGDQLTLLDGDFDAHGPSGALMIECAAEARNGTPANPIVVRADHPRRAHLFDGTTLLVLDACSFWEIDDLWLESHDDPNDRIGGVVVIRNGTGVLLRGLLAAHPNRYGNNHVVDVESGANITLEQIEAYDFFRDAFEVSDSSATTFRELYANGRGVADLPGGYVSACPGGDTGVESYYSRGGTFEDSIVEGVCDDGFNVVAGRSTSGDTGVGDNHHFYSDIAVGPGNQGFEVFTDCDAGAPCSSPDRIASANTFTNTVAVGFARGYLLEGVNNQLDHVSAFAPANQVGVQLDTNNTAGGYPPSAFVSAALATGGDDGILSQNQASWGVTSSNAVATNPYLPNDANVVGSTSIDPKLGNCEVYLPPGSPMIGAGPGGTSIGADIRFLTLDGTPTTARFWRADGTFTGCGAVVAGVNDDPSTACIGVHQRLNVGTPGCGLP